MAGTWKPITLGSKLFLNVKESVLKKGAAAIENAFYNETGGQTRFPGLREFVSLSGNAPTYLHEWDGDLIAESNSRIYRINRAGTAIDVTGVPLAGEGRAIFDQTEEELLMAKGAEILRLSGNTTEVLSADAPLSTHVGFIDGYVLAIESYTGRFQHSELDLHREWDPLDTFAANGKPDNLNAMLITPYREVMMTGVDSVEQFERLTQGSTPFFRRWSVGEGVYAPYTLVAEDQGVFGLNSDFEFVRFTGQTSEPKSDDIGRMLESIDNWKLAWAQSIHLLGQKFIILQAPFATNVHGTMGVTFLYDYRQRRWHTLFGWDVEKSVPSRWPGWSIYKMWGRNFVGGNGKVLELTEDTYRNDGVVQRMLGRTGHMDEWGECRIDDVRVRVKRGVPKAGGGAGKFGLRAIRDNGAPTRWNWKSLGDAGDKFMYLDFGPMGFARTWQFEWMVTDDVGVEVVTMQAQVSGAEQS